MKHKKLKSFEESFLEDDTLEKIVMKRKKLKKEAVTISVIKQSSPIAVVKEEFQDMDKFSILSIQAENSLKKIKETLNDIGNEGTNNEAFDAEKVLDIIEEANEICNELKKEREEIIVMDDETLEENVLFNPEKVLDNIKAPPAIRNNGQEFEETQVNIFKNIDKQEDMIFDEEEEEEGSDDLSYEDDYSVVTELNNHGLEIIPEETTSQNHFWIQKLEKQLFELENEHHFTEHHHISKEDDFQNYIIPTNGNGFHEEEEVKNKPKTEEGAIQIITVLDPSTGELIPQRVQTQMDPITGQMFQVPFQEVTDDDLNLSVDQVDYYSDSNDGTSLKEEIITILDPVTGEPVQQIFQKASSKKALYDGVEEERGGRGEVNHKKNLMKVMVDPQTGKEIHYSEEMIGTGISDDGTNYSTATGVAVFKMMTFTDPISGEPTQQMIQSIIDPVTGQTKHYPAPAKSSSNNDNNSGSPFQMVTISDPISGELTQQVVQTIIDPITGQTKQLPVPVANNPSNSSGGAGSTQLVVVKDPITGEQIQQVVQTVVDSTTGKTIQVPIATVDFVRKEISLLENKFTAEADETIVKLPFHSSLLDNIPLLNIFVFPAYYLLQIMFMMLIIILMMSKP